MEEKSNNQSNNQMSPFCEKLMEMSEPLAELRQPNDTAIIICTDGIKVANRQCGNYPDALRMVFTKMKADEKFAELIVEASIHYSRHLLKSYELFKEDTPIVQPIN